MRMITSVLLAALVLTLPLSVIAAPSLQSNIDIKTLALTKGDLPRGFEIVPDRTVSEDRPDGVAVYDVTFARERTAENLSSGPFEVRSGVARTAQVEDAVLQLESTREAFLGEGWSMTGVPALGDETLGLTQTTNGDGGQVVHYSYLFRKGAYILMIGIRGRPEATKLSDAVGLAITVSGRLDKALAGGAPPSNSSSSGSSPSTGSSTRQASGTGERVKVVNPDGGTVNVRADATTASEAIAQVRDGDLLDVVGPNKDGDGRTWRNVKTGDKTGWIASTLVETVAAPPPAPPVAPSPGPSPVPSSGPADTSELTAPVDEPAAEDETAPEPTPSPAPSPVASSGGKFQGAGNGLTVNGEIRETNLQSGKQLIKVNVTRNGRGVANAFVDVTARLDANRYRAFKLDRTSNDGWTEIEWEMEGPPGNYEVIVEVKTAENGPVTTAKGAFKWK